MLTDQRLVKALAALMIPAIIEYALQVAVSYADYIMVGKLGTNASAAVGLTEEVNFLLKGVLMAAGIGIVSFIAGSMGKQEYRRVKRASVQAFFVATAAGMLLFGVAMLAGPFLPAWMNADSAIRDDASSFFRIIYLPSLFISYNILMSSVLKGVGDMKTSMVVNVLMNALNIVINFFLIYGSRTVVIAGRPLHIWGAGLGVKGSATGTAVAAVVGGILMIAGVYRNPLVSPAGEKWAADREILRKFVKTAFPAFLCRVTTSSGRVLFSAFVAGLGTTAFAAHTIAFTAESACYMAAVGAQTAVTTLAGYYKGEGSGRRLNQLTLQAGGFIAVFMAGVCVLMIVLAKNVISLFTTDAEVIGIGARLFSIVALNEPVFGVSIILEGIFNGAGDTKSPFYISTATLWLVRVLGTWTAVNALGLGIYGAWIFMVTENAARCVALLIRYCFVKDRLIENEEPCA